MSEFRSLFDGKTLNGWYKVPRQPIMPPNKEHPYFAPFIEKLMDKERSAKLHRHTGKWEVVDGAIEGRQDPPEWQQGGFLISEEEFGNFELILEAKPDWPADTGIFIRATPDAVAAIQVLLDYRKSGGLAGFYGNGLGGFHAVAFNVDGEYDADGNMIGVKVEDPATSYEVITPDKPKLLTYVCSGGEFFRNWKFNDWNEYRIVCIGEIPVVTVYVNGLKAAEIDMKQISVNGYTPEDTLNIIGPKGHIAFEIHEATPDKIERWGKNVACRWRNIRIREL